MTETTNDLTRPIPLRTFLEYGGNPRDVLGDLWENLVEYIGDLPLDTKELRIIRAENQERLVESGLRGEPWAWATTDQASLTLKAWDAELHRDPSLAPAVLAFLTDEERRRLDDEADPMMPMPLDQYLDAGGDPRVVTRDENLYRAFGDAIVMAAMTPPSAREHIATTDRADAFEVVENRWTGSPMRGDLSPRECLKMRQPGDEHGWDTVQQYVNYRAWTADIIEHPELVGRIIALMTPEERTELDNDLDQAQHRYAFRIVSPSEQSHWWVCGSCGEAYDEGTTPQVTVPDDDNLGLAWCFDCVTQVYEALRAARGPVA